MPPPDLGAATVGSPLRHVTAAVRGPPSSDPGSPMPDSSLVSAMHASQRYRLRPLPVRHLVGRIRTPPPDLGVASPDQRSLGWLSAACAPPATFHQTNHLRKTLCTPDRPSGTPANRRNRPLGPGSAANH
ncbi:hypothetical protein COCNU_06G010680 [Cocos nucifera]|uniref:Uncharacterized protein n=1 Tax=Cocos nucifera TaxID=13894 RepID=A0A8K0IBD8_COCNU|nr:hypothetical protein COCNU_06G010680 [Cocos nucifera]